jgi:hypothetical protein
MDLWRQRGEEPVREVDRRQGGVKSRPERPAPDERRDRDAFRRGDGEIPCGPMARCVAGLATGGIGSLQAHQRLVRHRMVALRQARELDVVNRTDQPPRFSQAPVPVAENLLALTVLPCLPLRLHIAPEAARHDPAAAAGDVVTAACAFGARWFGGVAGGVTGGIFVGAGPRVCRRGRGRWPRRSKSPREHGYH